MARKSNKGFENEVLQRLPASDQLKISMDKIADHMQRAVEETRHLMRLREQFGDDVYFRALANACNLRAAFAEWIVQIKYFSKTDPEREEVTGRQLQGA